MFLTSRATTLTELQARYIACGKTDRLTDAITNNNHLSYNTPLPRSSPINY